MSSATLPSVQSHWRLVVAGLLLPASFVAIDRLLLDCVAGLWRSDQTVTLTMATFIVQIGVMGILCGRWVDLRMMRWIVYAWCWVLIDFQTLVAWIFTDPSWWGGSFQPASLFAAQLGLVMIWAVLGAARWPIRLPVALVAGCGLLLYLSRVRYEYENAAALIFMQVAVLGGICLVLRQKRFRVAVPRTEDRSFPSPAATDLRVSQFGLHDVLIWTTALALICGLVRWVGLPWEELADVRSISWLSMFLRAAVLSVTLVIAMWAALGTGSARVRCLLLLAIPALGIAVGLIDWLVWFMQWRPWTAPWYQTLSWVGWLYSIFWSPFRESARFTTAWLSLAGGMLFAALLFPRALGYRLISEKNRGA